MDSSAGLVNQTSSSQAKITLFRSLFRGRADVYPRRFESRKTGKSGYAPACANEWVRGITEHGVMDPARLYESPFTDVSPRGPEGVFTEPQVDELVTVLKEIRHTAAA